MANKYSKKGYFDGRNLRDLNLSNTFLAIQRNQVAIIGYLNYCSQSMSGFNSVIDSNNPAPYKFAGGIKWPVYFSNGIAAVAC